MIPKCKQTSTIFLSWLLICSFIPVSAAAQNEAEGFRAFRSVKKVRIEVQQSYGTTKDVNLPFEELARRFLKHAGVDVVEDGYDAILKMTAVGKPYGANYYDDQGRHFYLYTGAEVSGNIFLVLSRGVVMEKSFKGVKGHPGVGGGRIRFSGSLPDKPDSALFFNAFYNSDFTQVIAKMLGDIYGASLLISALKDEDLDKGSADALVAMGRPVTQSLLTALKDKDSRVREQAASILGRIGDARATQSLISALKDENPNVRSSAAFGLGEMRDVQAVEPLIAALKEKDPTGGAVKHQIEWGLVKITKRCSSLPGHGFGFDAARWQAWWEENRGKCGSK